MELVCWWCVHPHENGLPIHLPMKYEEKLNRFCTIGNFCSWACAKAYAIDMNNARKGEITSLLAMMRMRAIGHHDSCWPAPKRQALQCFGGSMTIEEFRRHGGKVEPPIIHYPFEHRYVPIVGGQAAPADEAKAVGTAKKNPAHLKAIEDSSGSSETLKLKRDKPLARTSSKLESMLGITRKTK